MRAEVAAALVLVSWLLVLASTYLAFRYPIKPDRYAHAFAGHLADRLVAYGRLLRSPWRRRNATLPAAEIDAFIREASARHGVEPALVRAVVAYESGFWPNAITTTGAMGLMALMPRTARGLGVHDPFDPGANVDGGTRLLRELLDTFAGDLDLTLAAYNAGEGAVRRAGGVPPYPETRDYVRHVRRLAELCRHDRA